jgi:hypothetical protein
MKLLGWIGCAAVAVSALAFPSAAQARDNDRDYRQRSHYSDRRAWDHREHRSHVFLDLGVLFSDRGHTWRRSNRYDDRVWSRRAPSYRYDRGYRTYGYEDRYGTYDGYRDCD